KTFDSALQVEKLPITYAITKSSGDSVIQQEWTSKDRIYKDMSGHAYYLELEDFSYLVIRKMWFEILMACLLLGVVATAFFFILNNLRKQQQLIQIKNDLISNITHELRTPIFTVSVALEALENFNAISDPERTKEYLNISKSELNRLSILVDK